MSTELHITVHQTGDHSVIAVAGDVDAATAPALRQALEAAFADGQLHVVLNLEHVPFLDSAGLGVLVAAHRLLGEHNGTFAVVSSSARLQELFRITNLDGVIELHESVEAATDI